MSNDERPLTIFNFYYYGADRWGASPFLGTRLVHHTTGYRWTDDSVFALQTVWLFTGALVFSRLSSSNSAVLAVTFLISLCLHRQARYLIFELSQLYAWQITAILLSWYSLRRLFEHALATARKRDVPGATAWLVSTMIFSFLAIWSSVASAVFLAFILSCEGLRAWLRGFNQFGRRFIVVNVLACVAIGSAALIELLQKMSYREYTLKKVRAELWNEFWL